MSRSVAATRRRLRPGALPTQRAPHGGTAMTERPQDDPTRDITLPPLPDRPPSALPREWASLDRPPADAPSVVQAPGSRSPADRPTDELGPRGGRPRERTIAF